MARTDGQLPFALTKLAARGQEEDPTGIEPPDLGHANPPAHREAILASTLWCAGASGHTAVRRSSRKPRSKPQHSPGLADPAGAHLPIPGRAQGCTHIHIPLPSVGGRGNQIGRSAQNIPCLVMTAKRRGQPQMSAVFVLSFCDTLQLAFSMLVWFFKAFEIHKLGITPKFFENDGFYAVIVFSLVSASSFTLLFITVQRYCAIVIVRPASVINTFKVLVTQFLPLISIVVIVIAHFIRIPMFIVYGTVLILNLLMNVQIFYCITQQRTRYDGRGPRMVADRRSLIWLFTIILFLICHIGILIALISVTKITEFEVIISIMFLHVNACASPILNFLFTNSLKPNWSTTEPSFALRLADGPAATRSEVQFQHALYHDIVVEYRP